MIVITNGYSGVLTSMLASPKLEPTVDSLDEWIAGGKFGITSGRNDYFGQHFRVRLRINVSLFHKIFF